MTYTTKQVCRIAGLRWHVINDWCATGIVMGFEGGDGQGDHRRYPKMVVLGVAVAAELRRSERGCNLEYVKKIVSVVADLQEKNWKKQLQRLRLDLGESDLDAIYQKLAS